MCETVYMGRKGRPWNQVHLALLLTGHVDVRELLNFTKVYFGKGKIMPVYLHCYSD